MKFISESIKYNDIESWSKGDKVIISAPTGSGKTTFIQSELYNYCKANNKKVLYLVNREILNRQLRENSNTQDFIQIETYQKVTYQLEQGGSLKLSDYDYIISDECHYFFSDSLFNKTTDILLSELTKNNTHNISIFMSATIDLFESYLNEYCPDCNVIKYEIDGQKNIRTVLYFKERDDIKQILNNIPKKDKAIVFFSSAQRAFEYAEEYRESCSFICSSGSMYYDDNMEFVKESIINSERFESKFLFTTSVLDNGINIKDSDVKHIIIDMLDKDTIIQCIGRKRFQSEDDHINLYLKKYNKREISLELCRPNNQYKIGSDFRELSPEEFISKYGRRNLNDILYLTNPEDVNISFGKEVGQLVCLKRNNALYHKLYIDRQYYNYLLSTNISNVDDILKRLKIDKQALNYNIVHDTYLIERNLLPYLNIYMYEDERFDFKNMCIRNFKTLPLRNNHISFDKLKEWIQFYSKKKYTLEKGISTNRKTHNLIYWRLIKKG